MKRAVGIVILLAGILGILAGCGKEESGGQIGIDGYAYLAEKVKLTDSWYGITACRVAGDGLYYSENFNGVGAVKRIALKTIEAALDKINRGDTETICRISAAPMVIPEGETVQKPEDYAALLDKAMDSKRAYSSERTTISEVWDPDKEYCRFYLNDFAVDGNQNVTYSLDIYRGDYLGMELVGSVLGRKDRDGQEIFRMYFQEKASFAVDGEGRIFVLQDQIWVLDDKGRRIETVDTDKLGKGDYAYEGALFGNGEGNVYYRIWGTAGSLYELREEQGRFVLKELEGLPLGAQDLFVESGGNILFTLGQENGVLYEWDRDDAAMKPLLRWQDIDVLPYEVQTVASMGEGRLILLSSSTEDGGMFVLQRMPVEELPKREILVLASLHPDTDLLRMVRRFNRLSNEYRIVVERYGAEGAGYYNARNKESVAVYQDAIVRLDAALVSSNPPDILDLNDIDILKYTDREILEDLAPYLEEKGIYKEDYLENVWEGFTVGGRLVCLPREVLLTGITMGRASQTDGLAWTMESLYELAERYPDKELIYDMHRGDLLDFCSAYYLDRFVDWNTGECSFDSPEFQKLLVWVQEHSREEGDYAPQLKWDTRIPEDVLLVGDWMWEMVNFSSALKYYTRFDGDFRILGVPTADGKGKVSYRLFGALGVVSNGAHKEGAYAFLEYTLTAPMERGSTMYHHFDTTKAWLEECVADITEKKWKMTGVDGQPEKEYGYATMYNVILDGEEIGYLTVPQDLVDQVTGFLTGIDFSPEKSVNQQIRGIVEEEAAGYYGGDKTLEEVTDVIQRRVQILVQENVN